MTITERENLAQAYMSAWNAVKRNPIIVRVMPNGWFEKQHYGYGLIDKVRASSLLEGLVTLTQRLEAKSKAVRV
jgi:oligoribonuclease (3'-5' exoribonuclease)